MSIEITRPRPFRSISFLSLLPFSLERAAHWSFMAARSKRRANSICCVHRDRPLLTPI
ncbi:hypothetical protein B0G69_8039 [Paraburkholderia sp. RAU2J]|nr:hypothetical protein B0G69_8039 [Paraburkholderia sp. RAU2J]